MPESNSPPFHTPPPPQTVDLQAAWPFIESEARRQLEAFYPVMDKDSEKRVVGVISAGIVALLKRGAARLEEGRIRFWNPIHGAYQAYDADYNRTMVDVLRDFTSRRRRPAEARDRVA